MSKKSNISFDQIPDLPGLEETLRAVDRTFVRFGIGYFLVGAFARDVWVAYLQDASSPVRTKDIDFAVRISGMDEFQALKDHLIREEGFVPSSQNAFILHAPSGLQIDLLPFGSSSLSAFAGVGKTTASNQGFQEVFADARAVHIGDRSYLVSSLPGLVVLKLMAWQDRPELRSKDLGDVFQILFRYEQLMEDDLYDDHLDLLTAYTEEGPLYLRRIGARILGRHLKSILNRSKPLRERILGLIQEAIASEQSALIKSMGAQHTEATLKEIYTLLSDLRDGIQEAES